MLLHLHRVRVAAAMRRHLPRVLDAVETNLHLRRVPGAAAMRRHLPRGLDAVETHPLLRRAPGAVETRRHRPNARDLKIRVHSTSGCTRISVPEEQTRISRGTE